MGSSQSQTKTVQSGPIPIKNRIEHLRREQQRLKKGWLTIFALGGLGYVAVFEYVAMKKKERYKQRRERGLPTQQIRQQAVIDTEDYIREKQLDEQRQGKILS